MLWEGGRGCWSAMPQPEQPYWVKILGKNVPYRIVEMLKTFDVGVVLFALGRRQHRAASYARHQQQAKLGLDPSSAPLLVVKIPNLSPPQACHRPSVSYNSSHCADCRELNNVYKSFSRSCGTW